MAAEMSAELKAELKAELRPSSRPSLGRAQCAIGLALSACSYSSGSMLRPDTWLGLGLGSGSGLPDTDIEPEGGVLHGAGPKGQGCRRVRVKAAQARCCGKEYTMCLPAWCSPSLALGRATDSLCETSGSPPSASWARRRP